MKRHMTSSQTNPEMTMKASRKAAPRQATAVRRAVSRTKTVARNKGFKGGSGARSGKTAKAVTLASASMTMRQNEEALRIIKALKGWGSIEIKVVVPVQTHRATIESIGLDPVEAQPRQAYFFDTPDFALNKAGVVVRARRIQGGRADTVVKLRPVDPAAISPALRRSASFKVELDAMPAGGLVVSGSLKGASTGEAVLAATSGAAPLRSLFSKEQLAYFEKHAPKGITMESLVTLGPTYLLKSKHNPKSFGRRIVVEMWLYPDGSRILEISTKCLPEEAFQTAVEFKAYLANCGINLAMTDATKTKSAMEYFRRRLTSGPPAA
jgi:hypothetical protein